VRSKAMVPGSRKPSFGFSFLWDLFDFGVFIFYRKLFGFDISYNLYYIEFNRVSLYG